MSYWCFAPGISMQELEKLGTRSILVTSGTLSPMPSFAMELGISFPVQLSNPHVMRDPKKQIFVRVFEKGVSGNVLNSSFQTRSTKQYLDELANTLCALWRVIPGGVLVFFPSYGLMESCLAAWGASNTKPRGHGFFDAKTTKSAKVQNFFPHRPSSSPETPWKRLLNIKPILLEPRSTHALPESIATYTETVSKRRRGCALFGVCRGKISEGIDFKDDLARAVIVTGLPFAPFMDPKVKLKREYLDSAGGLSGGEWYAQQA